MSRVQVVKKADLRKIAATSGITREVAFDSGKIIAFRAHGAPGVVSGWHHHGDHDYVAYMVSGRARIEYGLSGREAVEVGAGEFFSLPPRKVHRDINPAPKEEQSAVIFLAGTGPWVVNVEGPEA